MSTAAKPVPDVTAALAPFFAAAREQRLVMPRCTKCGTRRFPPRETCSMCLGRDFDWAESSGRGRIVTYNVMHQVYHPGFAGEVPYAVVLVELEDGGRLVSNVVDCPLGRIGIDLAVEVTFERVSDTVTLPKFRPVTA